MRIQERGNVHKALTHLAPFKLANSQILRQLYGAHSVITFWLSAFITFARQLFRDGRW